MHIVIVLINVVCFDICLRIWRMDLKYSMAFYTQIIPDDQ